jgi:hypothetical protein
MATKPGYERQEVREAQSDLALLAELDSHAFQIVTALTKTWTAICLDAENPMTHTRG